MYGLSIVTVCKDDLLGLKRTIRSLDKMRVTSADVELVLVDGNSTDGTKEYLSTLCSEDYSISWVSEDDNGIYAAMNKGVRRATGKWVMFMNAGDELIYEGNISELVKDLDDNYFMFAFSYIRAFCTKGKLVTARMVSDWNLRMPTSHQAMIFQKNCLDQFPFRENLRVCGDYESFLRLRVESGMDYRCDQRVISRFFWGGTSTQDITKLYSESSDISRQYARSSWHYRTRSLYFSAAILKVLLIRWLLRR